MRTVPSTLPEAMPRRPGKGQGSGGEPVAFEAKTFVPGCWYPDTFKVPPP